MEKVTYTQQAVVEETDVLVVGGGTAGLASALASARKGVKTTLVENSGNLGGMATIGLVGPFMTCFSSDGKDQIVKGIFDEVVRRMEKREELSILPAYQLPVPILVFIKSDMTT